MTQATSAQVSSEDPKASVAQAPTAAVGAAPVPTRAPNLTDTAPAPADTPTASNIDAADAPDADADAADGKVATQPTPKGKRSLKDRLESYVSELSTRNNFWHRVCSWIWLPFAYHSGIKMKKQRDGSSFTAVLPFRRFNRNWYSAMAGAALLGNTEIAGGMYVFQECEGKFRVVCKHLEYKFLRPCVGPASYEMTPQEDLKALSKLGTEFNITLDIEVMQVMRTPNERPRRVGKAVVTFHCWPINDDNKRKRKRLGRHR